MIKRTVEISQHPSHLSVRLEQLQVRRHTDDQSAPLAGSVPCEDIGLLVLDEQQNTMTQHALASLADAGAAVLICGSNHLPRAMLLPLSEHTEVLNRLNVQLEASKPTAKRLWQQIVQAKVSRQAANLSEDSTAYRKLSKLRGEVKSGDTTNIEAQAAKVYWQALRDSSSAWATFKRSGRNAKDLHNGLLNYGYAVMRAAVARAIVSAGLLPMIGLHHANRSNAFGLADDLVEPLRPVVDGRVARLIREHTTAIDRASKQALLELLTVACDCGDQSGPLMVQLHRYTASLVKCLSGENKQLDIPTARQAERF